MLVISGPASAVQVGINADGLNNRHVGETGFFFINITIGANERIPIANISMEGLPDIPGSPGGILVFKLGDFDNVGDSIKRGNYRISLIEQFGLVRGYGYGYGYALNRNNPPFSGYGYGNKFFGYGYGYGQSTIGTFTRLSYKVNVDTTGASPGTYNVAAKVNTGQKVVFEGRSSFILTPVPALSRRNGGGGDGTGGGGVTSSEPVDNIEKAETQRKNLVAGIPVTYTFISPELGIYEIAVTGKKTENFVSLRVEALKSTSRIVTAPPAGTVIKNVNIWAGTALIEEALIRFKVRNSLLDENDLGPADIKMIRWDGSTWIDLETDEKMNDGIYTYFEARSDTFSPFAITGMKAEAVPQAAAPPPFTPVKVEPAETGPAVTPEKGIPGFEAIISAFVIILSGTSLIRSKRRR